MAAATRAVLLDALGTLVALDPPAPRLHEALGGRLPLDDVERAMRAEMSHYRAHSHEARDAGSLAALRERCAAILTGELGVEVSVETMMSAIRFRAYADAAPALAGLRGRGLALVCVSNWDCSLPEVLERIGLARLLDGVVVSAAEGHAKPEPELFEAALELAGCAAGEALAVGDTEVEDVAGARASGIPALLLVRGAGTPEPGTIASLAEISDHLQP